jgi:glycosyltransferase involved in cell wall biosynthesis
MKRAIHIYLSPFEYESRILKEVKTLIEYKIVDEILVIAAWKVGLKSEEIIYPGIRVKRIKLSSLGITDAIKAILAVFRVSSKNQQTLAENHDFQVTEENLTFNVHFAGNKSIVSRIKRAAMPFVDGISAFMRNIFRIVTTLRICFIILINKPIFLNIHHVDLLHFAWLKKFSKRLKVVYDTHELETETQGCVGLQGVNRRRKEAKFIVDVDFTIVVTPSIEKWYRKAYGLENIVTIRNVPFYQEVEGLNKNYFKDKFGLNKEDYVFLYQGGLFHGRGLIHLLEAFAEINSKKFSVVFMGYGELKNRIFAYTSKYENIFFHEAVAPDVILQYTVAADVGVALTENVCLSYYYGLGNKIFEYTMAEVPLLVSNMIDMADYVSSNQIGLVVPSFEIDDIIKSIKQITRIINTQLHENIKKAKIENNWEIESQLMLDGYRKMTT